MSAVCLFCDHQSETMELIYAHMKVQAHSNTIRRGNGKREQTWRRSGDQSRSERFFRPFRSLTALTCTS